MLRLGLNKKKLAQLESMYEGITEQIMRFENAVLPPCPHCGSDNTADVQVGLIGRTINISAATTKFKLLMNGPKPGDYYCLACEKYFNQKLSNKGKGKDLKSNKERKPGKARKPNVPGGFTSRPADKSLAAYKRWINGMADALGAEKSDMTEQEWREGWKEFWSD